MKLFLDLSMSFLLKRNGIDIFYALGYFVRPERKTKVAKTFHDLFALVIPEFNPKATNRVRRLWYAKVIKRSARIIADYYSTKNDLLKFFNLDGEKITVTHEAAGATLRPKKDEGVLNSIRSKSNLNFRFILASGGLHARKNPEGIISSFSKSKGGFFFEYKFVFFGGSSRLPEIWAPLIGRLKLEDQMVFIYPVPEEELPAIYSLVDPFVCPSLYEAFGIPILEATSCGTPVITCNLASMPELAGDTTPLVDPTNMEQLTGTMYQVMNGNSLRNNRREKGFKKVTFFSGRRLLSKQWRFISEYILDDSRFGE